MKKKDKELADRLYFYLIGEPKVKDSLKDAYDKLKDIDPEFARIFGQGLFFSYSFQYKNPKLTIDEFLKKFIKDYLEDELEIEEVKTLSQEYDVPLIHASALRVFNERAGIFLKQAQEYSNSIINSIKYASQLMKELSIWERINNLYENLIKYAKLELNEEDESKKRRYRTLAEIAMGEMKDYWLNNYDKMNPLFQIQRFGFAGIVNDFKRFWEDGLVLQLISDDIEERNLAKEIIFTLVRLGLLRKYIVTADIESTKEELIKKYKTLQEAYEKIKELSKEENLSEVKQKIKKIEENFNIKKLEKDLVRKYPEIRYIARIQIVSQKLNIFYDWLYTNYKVVKSAYLSYRALLRLLIYNLTQFVKAYKWNMKMYQLSKITKLNPYNLEWLKKAYMKFKILAAKDLNLSDKDKEKLDLLNKEIKGKVKLVIFIDLSVDDADLIFNQDIQSYLLVGEYNINFYLSFLTEEDYNYLKTLELSQELKEIDFIAQEFLESFVKELKAFVDKGFYFRLSEFIHKTNYSSLDLKELIKLLFQKDPELSKKLEEIYKEKKEESNNKKDFINKIIDSIKKLSFEIVKNSLIYPFILSKTIRKIIKKEEEKEEEKKETIKDYELVEKLKDKIPPSITDFVKEKFLQKLKSSFNVRKEFINDKLFKV